LITEGWLQLTRLRRVENLRPKTLPFEQLGLCEQMLEPSLGPAYVHRSALAVPKLETLFARQLDEELAAVEREIAEAAEAAEHPVAVAAANELTSEAQEREREAWLHTDSSSQPGHPKG
jgi:hypothetical protein